MSLCPPRIRRFRRIGVLSVVGAVLAAVLSPRAPADVDFNHDVRPILSNKCFRCHGPDENERKAKLRLDTPDGSANVIVPGKPRESELIYRVTAEDPDDVMPPPDAGARLTSEEAGLLRQWISEGAAYRKHWAYERPIRPVVPWHSVAPDRLRMVNPIDAFIARRLQDEGLAFSPEADPHALIRRVTLDLTGLPPSPKDVRRFVRDPHPNAYDRLLDRLLPDPAYGEHLARAWLDLARYADSAGYADDPLRTIWAYRDYVIGAFNENKPFDRFTLEQVAGDLLEHPTEAALVATGFHRNTQTNNEGGTSDEEYRNVAVVDRVNTTMQVWMGTTFNCAQCHTHKYDPITQEEYFKFFALFNNTEDADRRDESPTIPLYSDAQIRQRGAWESELNEIEARLASLTPELNKAIAGWERDLEVSPPLWMPVKPLQMRSRSGATLALREDASILVSGNQAETDVYTVAIEPTAGPVTAVRLEALADQMLPENGPGRNGNFVLSEFELSTSARQEGQTAQFALKNASASFAQKDFEVTKAIDGKNDAKSGWAVAPKVGESHEAVFELSRPVEGEALTFTLRHAYSKLALGRFRLSWTSAPPPVRALPDAIAEILARSEERSENDWTSLRDYFTRIYPPTMEMRKRADELRRRIAGVEPMTTVPIMRELPEDQRRRTHVQYRGNFLDPGPEVSPGVPEVSHPLAENAAPNRLSLAWWLVDEENPLTARVIANRWWEKIFGIGLVATSEEFGSQGELPSHPELLDWLALDLRDSGWNQKRFVKQLVSSTTYRQSSKVTKQLLERDPQNRLLARGPRFRLTAEMVRDQALAAAGLLSRKMYGDPVRPPQPRLGVSAAFGSGIDWKTSEGEDGYRRGLYTTWRRSNPYPSMAAFDAPNREVCTVRRDRTNTPLQAFVTLNDPVYIEAAQALARRMAKNPGPAGERIRAGFWLCVGRGPEASEGARMEALYETALAHFRERPEAAIELIGELPPPAVEGSGDLDAAEAGALTVVANVLLNLDEALMKR